MATTLDPHGVIVDSVSIPAIDLDSSTQAAVDRLATTQQDIKRAQNEQTRAEIDAEMVRIREQEGALTPAANQRYCLEIVHSWDVGENGCLPATFNCAMTGGNAPAIIVGPGDPVREPDSGLRLGLRGRKLDQVTVYLDHAATTPVLPEVIDLLAQTMRDVGNASSLHTAGRAARRVVEESRESIASDLRVRPSEVVFTSGGTESDNMAVKGSLWRQSAKDPRRRRLLISAIEHHAVLDPVEHLVTTGQADVSWLMPDAEGVIHPEALQTAVVEDPDSVGLVSVMWANNENGVVQPITELAEIAHAVGAPLHTDAVQAVGQLALDLGASGADMVTMTGHKIGGPLGVGVLVAGRDQDLVPLTHGGGQERQLRSGTLDVPGIAGLALAVRSAVADQEQEAHRLAALRDMLIEGAQALDPSITVGGLWQPGEMLRRLPGNAHLLVPDCDGDSLLYLLDAAGVQCSTGSACQAGVPQPSHVLLAMGMPEAQARGALRLTLGHTSTEQDVHAFLDALPAATERARRARHASDRAS